MPGLILYFGKFIQTLDEIRGPVHLSPSTKWSIRDRRNLADGIYERVTEDWRGATYRSIKNRFPATTSISNIRHHPLTRFLLPILGRDMEFEETTVRLNMRAGRLIRAIALSPGERRPD